MTSIIIVLEANTTQAMQVQSRAYEQDFEAGSQQKPTFLPAPLVNLPLADQIRWADLGNLVGSCD